jgi:tRNA-dependent cyclodipeptide synthase
MLYKAKLRGLNRDIEYVKDKKAAIPISVGQHYHEKDKLISTLSMNSKLFHSCDIIVADSLQRHTIKLFSNCSMRDAANESIALGNEWIKRNENILKYLTIPFRIIQWEDCVNTKNFLLYFEKIKEYYHNNIEYKKAFQADIEIFKARFKKQYPNYKVSNASLEKACLIYLFEEIAVYLSFFLEEKYDYVIYPSKMPNSVLASKKIFISHEHQNLLTNLIVYFKKKGQHKNIAQEKYTSFSHANLT